MRETPTWRIPFGIIGLFVGLIIYAAVVARYIHPLIRDWHGAVLTVIYLMLGLIWLLPLKRFLVWMETGRWAVPGEDQEK